MTAPALEVVPFGDAAVLVRIAVAGGIEGARRARAVANAIESVRAAQAAIGEPVPAAGTVLVPFDPLALTTEQAAALIEPALRLAADDTSPGSAGSHHEIAVRYGGEDGPDLEAVAAETGLTPRDVVDLHAGTTYEVLFLGFAPGFAYLGELPEALRLPRLATPRPRVPAGSVAIAGAMTAVYAHPSPGGWRLLGRTDAAVFDAASSAAARLRPGDRVRFVPVR
ncbi:MAG TPA: 5-oxoprolinase subunit PxpB [Candidatus Limnocylindrales bacterium]|nr:5-oxoprolinase subunit PxpB [Candidatus Limnocylindrales bacterium]